MAAPTPVNLGFLLGAGSSIPAGFPSTAAVTEAVYRAEHQHSVARQETLQLFTRSVGRRIERNLRLRGVPRPANYEDVFSACEQMYDDLLSEFENPTVYPFTKRLATKLVEVLARTGEDLLTFNTTLQAACDLVRETLLILLGRVPTAAEVAHLDLFKSCTDDPNIEDRIRVFTLTHDLSIETYCDLNGLSYCDGFESTGGTPVWNPNVFATTDASVLLYKLHGSINWFRRPRQNWSPWHKTGAQDNADFPDVLIGNLNKMRNYSGFGWDELHHEAWRSLAQVNLLFVAGYSFGDKGINNRVLHWMDGDDGRFVVLAHDDLYSLMSTCRPAVRRMLRRLAESKRLRLIRKMLPVDYADIVQAVATGRGVVHPAEMPAEPTY